MGKTFEFSEGVTFNIQFSFNKNYIETDELKSLKNFVKNEKGISKSLSIKLYIETFSIGKAFVTGLKNIFFERKVDERYWKIPHIGYNYKLKKFKLIESQEKMRDYIPDQKKITVFYTPYKCVLVNRINIHFIYYNNVVKSNDYENFGFFSLKYLDNEHEIITKF